MIESLNQLSDDSFKSLVLDTLTTSVDEYL